MDKRMLNIIRNYFTTQPVVRAWVFGSFARGEANPDSDIDILVTIDKGAHIGLMGFAAMAVDLESMLNRPVDIVVDDGKDLMTLRKAGSIDVIQGDLTLSQRLGTHHISQHIAGKHGAAGTHEGNFQHICFLLTFVYKGTSRRQYHSPGRIAGLLPKPSWGLRPGWGNRCRCPRCSGL